MSTKTVLAAFFFSFVSANLQLRSIVTLCDTDYRVTGLLDGGDRPVYKAITSRTSTVVAIKSLPVDYPTDLIKKTLSQQSSMRLFCIQTLDKNLYVVMEEGESLVNAIRAPHRLTEIEMWSHINSLARSIRVLRQYGLVFSNIETKNLIITMDGLKISKFGSLMPLEDTDDHEEL